MIISYKQLFFYCLRYVLFKIFRGMNFYIQKKLNILDLKIFSLGIIVTLRICFDLTSM